jgi:hypothetical protein
MNARAFSGLPRLPVVPPPIAGETLSGWVSCLGEIYGLPADRLLRGVGASPPRQLRWLDIAPSSRVLATLSAQTGVAATFMRERMTFHRLGRELVPTVLVSKPLCRRCVVEAEAAGRMVERLRWIAPWRFACEQHPPPVSGEEVDGRLDAAAMLRDVTLFSKRLSYAAAEDPSRPFPSIARSTADCIRLVRGINDRLRLRVRAGHNGVAVFEVREVRPGLDEAIAPERRNHLVVSAWYAWHVMANPDGAIYQRTRSADREQAHALTVLLAGFLPGEQMVAVLRLGAELGTAARWRPRDPDDNAARQARLLQDLMSAMSDAHPIHSPFEYPDFGRRFVPAFYQPGPLLTARCESIPLRTAAWPPTRPSIEAPAPSPSPPSPTTLEPYLALVQEARAKLAARGGRVRSVDVERLAFRLLRERRLSHD